MLLHGVSFLIQSNKIIYCALLVDMKTICGPGSSVGKATDYGLDGLGLNPGGDEIFRPIQTGPGAYGRAADHSPPSSAVVMEE